MRTGRVPDGLGRARADLAVRLQARRDEIEQAVGARIEAIGETADPGYLDGLREAVTAAIAYGLEAIDREEDTPPPVPDRLLSQARMAARNAISLDTILRRYVAGYSLFGNFILEEADRSDLVGRSELQRLLAAPAFRLDCVIGAVSAAHADEVEKLSRGSEGHVAVTVRRLIDGELVDASRLRYEFDDHHLAAVAIGAGAVEAMRMLGPELDRNTLVVPNSEGTVWIWFGGRRPLKVSETMARLRGGLPAGVRLAVGENGQGMAGWRLSHRQAITAFTVILRGAERVVRYRDVALLASVLGDDVLTSSLRRMYLSPLEASRDRGEALRETLRAYLAAGLNATSAASALGVSRNTVMSRLQTAESLLGIQLPSRVADLDVALRLERFTTARP